MCVKVFLADDAAVMRKAIRSLLSNREDISVVGEASNFRETIEKTSELHPDLIILDLNMPDRNHIAASARAGGFVAANRISMGRCSRRATFVPTLQITAVIALLVLLAEIVTS